MLAKKKINEYVKTGGVRCPYCGSEGISAGNLTLDSSDNVMSNVQCFNCKKEWREVYSLFTMIELCPACGRELDPDDQECTCGEGNLEEVKEEE
jgi:ssDNA-binding Zn-finger/Zn-ribbon topoisomerase 1